MFTPAPGNCKVTGLLMSITVQSDGFGGWTEFLRQSFYRKADLLLTTPVRCVWSDRFLYLGYESPFTTLTDFGPAEPGERVRKEGSLWDKDVVEFFCGSDTNRLRHYTEYEWAPNSEALDLRLRDGAPDFAWSSGMEWKAKLDQSRIRLDLLPLHFPARHSRRRPQPDVLRLACGDGQGEEVIDGTCSYFKHAGPTNLNPGAELGSQLSFPAAL